jgi:hypothetical protein
MAEENKDPIQQNEENSQETEHATLHDELHRALNKTIQKSTTFLRFYHWHLAST